MARKKKADKPKPLSIEDSRRLQGSAASEEARQKAKDKKAAEDAEVKGTTESVVAKKVEGVIPTGEDQGPSAAPKQRLKKTPLKKKIVDPFTKKQVRPATTRELKRGVVAVTVGSASTKGKKTRKRTTTKTGKPLDPKTGKIDTSKIKKGRIGKLDGKTVRVDDSNIEDVKRDAVTTVLPTAGPETERPSYELPSAGRDKFQGFSTSNPEDHKRLKDHVNQAWSHIGGMIRTRGTDEYHAHHEAFNKVHAEIAGYHPSMGRILDMAYTAVHKNPDHPDTPKALAMAKQAAGDTIKAGQSAAEGRAASQQKARAERMARIRAEREGS
jgi:hypothetical protein